MAKLYSVQYLRALAALLVIYCHAIDVQVLSTLSFQQQFFFLENFGAIGVDIFFVISGFIIAIISTNDTGLKAVQSFTKKRFIRILPLYYIATCLCLAVFSISPNFKLTGQEIIKSIVLLPIFDTGARYWSTIIPIAWTLGFEYLFYFIYAGLIACSIFKKDRMLLIITGALVLLGVVFKVEQLQLKFITNPMLLEFALGVAIAMLFKSDKKVPYLLACLLFASGIFCFVALIFFGYGAVSEAGNILNEDLGLQRVFIWGIPSALLVAGLIFMEKSKAIFFTRNKTWAFLGDASYSLYLVHPICYYVLAISFRHLDFLKNIPGDFIIIICVLTAIIAGCLFHIIIEKPLLKKLGVLMPASKPKSVLT